MKEISWFIGPMFLLALIWPEWTAGQVHKWVNHLEAGWHRSVDD